MKKKAKYHKIIYKLAKTNSSVVGNVFWKLLQIMFTCKTLFVMASLKQF